MKSRWILISVIVLSVMAVIVYRWKFSAPKVTWQEIKPTEGELTIKVTADGTVTPKNKLVVNTPISGRIDKVFVEEGAKVHKGQELALLSSSDRVALMDSLQKNTDQREKQRLQNMYRPTPILAPAAGTIVLRSINQGQSVNVESTLFEISDQLIVISKVDETDIAKVKIGQSVEIGIDAYSSESFKGSVDRIGQQSTVTNNVTTYDVFITAQKIFPDNIKSGMSASVDYLTLKKDKVLLIPAWLAEGRKNTSMDLLVKNSNDEPQQVSVKLGESNGESVEVLGGLTLDSQVLYKPLTYENDAKGVPFNIGNKRK